MKLIPATSLFPSNIKSIYLAAPFFNETELDTYRNVIDYLRNGGYEVYVPREHEIDGAWDLHNHIWGKMVFNEDVDAIRRCDATVVINWGMYSDSGTAWEQGFAYGLGKPVVSIMANMEMNGEEFSLMMCNGCSLCVQLSNLVDFGNYDFTACYEQK